MSATVAAPRIAARQSSAGRLLPAILLAPIMLWIVAFFALPIALMAWQSIEQDGFASYHTILTQPLYLKVLLETLKISLITTFGCLVLGYPVAYVLVFARPAMRSAMLVMVVLPYWLDYIVRSYSWMVLLGRRGVANQMLQWLGVSDHPLPLLCNLASVSIGMTQVLLPLTILTLFGAMLRIDRRLLNAAAIHGATPLRAFLTVFLPLSLPGVFGASLLAFVTSLGFYITPALLGSPQETMISQTIMVLASDLLDWPMASAAGVLLLVVTTILTLIYNRFFNLGRMFGNAAE